MALKKIVYFLYKGGGEDFCQCFKGGFGVLGGNVFFGGPINHITNYHLEFHWQTLDNIEKAGDIKGKSLELHKRLS